MKTILWSLVLVLGAISVRAQPAPDEGGPDGPPEMMEGQEDRQPDRPQDRKQGRQQPPRPGMGGRGGGTAGPGPGMGLIPGTWAPAEPELSDAQEKELVDFIKANEPMMAEHLAKEKGTPSYKQRLGGLWRMYKDPSERDRWIKQARARKDVREYSAQYQRAPDAEKPAIKEKLSKSLGDLFDADLAERTRQIEALEAQAVKAKERLAKRRAAKDRIVSQRADQLTGEGVDDWQW